MVTDEGSGGGGGGGGGDEIRLDAEAVREIARQMGQESRVFAETDFATTGLSGTGFGGSEAGRDLGAHYDGAHADSVTQNTECEAMLGDYEQGLAGAVQDLQESDELNAAALRRISDIDPGR